MSVAPPAQQRPIAQKPLLLFDLDGTLLSTAGAGARAMERAGKLVWGETFTLGSINFGGSLDPVIVEEAVRLASLGFDAATHRAFRLRYSAELVIELERPETRALALPGVLGLLDHLRSVEVAQVGLLTGNYEETGVQKLSAVGIDPTWFSPRVWGDAGPTRPDLVRVALAREAHPSPDTTIVIGDTERDVHCAKVNGCKVVGVATGSCSGAELERAGADLVLDDLAEPAPLLALIEALSR